MKLQVIRTQFGKDATSGLLFINGIFECYTLEDQYQAVKVMHETCIPEGTYDIKLRTTGGFHARYAAKYGIMHHGMLHIQDVPCFEYILIHTGNTDENTSGCLILGNIGADMTSDAKEKAQEVVVPVILTRIASMAAFVFRRS